MLDIVPITKIRGYYAHVCFEPESVEALKARQLMEQAEIHLARHADIGRWHGKPVGPHTTGSFQMRFSTADFNVVVPWLALNAGHLSILIQPETGDIVADFSEYAIWIGEPVELRLEFFEEEVMRRAQVA